MLTAFAILIGLMIAVMFYGLHLVDTTMEREAKRWNR